MTTKLLTRQGVWQRLTELACSQPGHVAVAYFGQEAADFLPLRPGSILVVNLEEETVRNRSTCPMELLKLHRQGVKVYNCADLHAKVFVFDKAAIVGSANASTSSKNDLVEAAVEFDGQAVVDCRSFVKSLALAESLCNETQLEKLGEIYKTAKNNIRERIGKMTKKNGGGEKRNATEQAEMLAKYPTLAPVAYVAAWQYGEAGAWEMLVEEENEGRIDTCKVHVYYHNSGDFDPKNPKASRYCGSRMGVVAALRAVADRVADELAESAVSENKPAKQPSPKPLMEKAQKGGAVATK